MEPKNYTIVEIKQNQINVIKWLYDTIHAKIIRKKRLKELQENLFWVWKGTANVDAGCDHPQIPRHLIHPDNRIALEDIYRSLLGYFGSKSQVNAVENMGLLDLTKNVCSIGSPMSTMMSRIGMGYETNSEKLDEPPKTKLPIFFNFDKKELGRVSRKLAGKRWTPWNWSLVDSTDNSFDGTPETDDDGNLRTDFLLLTVMPNTLSREGLESRRVHEIFAGCHGPGTKATKLVLENLNILEKISEEKRSNRFFQTIIKVPKLKHTSRYCIPQSVEYVKTIPLDNIFGTHSF